MADARPRVSVIVPARDCADTLAAALTALRASDLPATEREIIVVDDGSRDATADVAARLADRVVRLEGGPHGPAHARNRGAEVARAPYLVFVDADVCVHASVLRGFAERLDAAPGRGAVFGAYDAAPPAPGLVSQYRNLVHHWVHTRHAGEAHTFWAGCGAVRAAAFHAVGGFDGERYPRPQIEDIELGHRLRDAGWHILLDPALQGKHLKRWTLAGGLRTDIRDRGVPWARLILEGPGDARASALNLRPAEKIATALVGLAIPVGVLGPILLGPAALAPAAVLLGAALVPSLPLLAWLARVRGPLFAVRAVPLRLLYYLANGVSVLIAAWQRRRDARGAAAPSSVTRLRA